MKVTRWPAILIFALLLSASLIIQPDDEVASDAVVDQILIAINFDFIKFY